MWSSVVRKIIIIRALKVWTKKIKTSVQKTTQKRKTKIAKINPVLKRLSSGVFFVPSKSVVVIDRSLRTERGYGEAVYRWISLLEVRSRWQSPRRIYSYCCFDSVGEAACRDCWVRYFAKARSALNACVGREKKKVSSSYSCRRGRTSPLRWLNGTSFSKPLEALLIRRNPILLRREVTDRKKNKDPKKYKKSLPHV